FFFSSSRRHTRFSRDWSSDVCSSDLRDLVSVFKERIASYNHSVNPNQRCYLKPIIRFTSQNALNPLLEFKWVRKYNAKYLKATRSEEHTSELQSRENLVCRLLLEKKK